MDTTKYLIIAKGKYITKNVVRCNKNLQTNKYDITFDNGSMYSYAFQNVQIFSNPQVKNPSNYLIETREGKELYGIQSIYEFVGYSKVIWHIVFDGFEADYKKEDLVLKENCLVNTNAKSAFDYLKEVSELSSIRNDSGEKVLHKYYEKMGFVNRDSALGQILYPQTQSTKEPWKNVIYPFGCNQSQYVAVRSALENQISVIQGPPGTGKTQTILNIVANIVLENKTVMIVSNNNSATGNVLEKLASEKYGMDFLVAPLGSAENKNHFLAEQSGTYPDLDAWTIADSEQIVLTSIGELAEQLQRSYKTREILAKKKAKKYEIEIEAKHFEEYAKTEKIELYDIKLRSGVSSERIMQLLQEIQDKSEIAGSLSFWTKLLSVFLYGIADWKFFQMSPSRMITLLQGAYYRQSIAECEKEIANCEGILKSERGNLDKLLEEKSLAYLKQRLAKRYDWKKKRIVFSENDLYKKSREVLNEYPIVLSTTFSSRASLNPNQVEYDYVIMDEASQVDIATGALALACAKHAVIVGDQKQLPNVVDAATQQKADAIRARYKVSSAFDFANKSFLQMIIEAVPNAPKTLLREHYRCHPRIIEFCNQKFYEGKLVVMTEDDDTGEALTAIRTVEGNHERDKYNQRQIDVIKEEILPHIKSAKEQIGIIAPYNAQVEAIHKQIPDIDVATVHKFQGREKDVIILSTVDDQISDFADDPFLLNVAVSRAKKRLIVVVSGNKQKKQGNINDLISYIQYNKMEVLDSRIYSVFDYLYSQYREARWEYLKKNKRISEYDSENLTYSILQDIIKAYPIYGVVCFVPLGMVVKDYSNLSDEEKQYATRPGTHLDFLIYNKLGKQPALAVETDGYSFHKTGTAQAERDKLKNHILEVCGIPLVRLATNGSGEKEKILRVLGE